MQIIEQALENNGHDLDLAIKCLNDLRLGCADKVPAIADNSLDACPQPNDQPRGKPDNEILYSDVATFSSSCVVL